MYFATKNFKEAIRFLGMAAEQGNAEAQNYLGVMYSAAKNFKEAIRFFGMAAEQGNADAQNVLGAMYYQGLGVAQDYSEAVRYHSLAAAQGNASSQFTLGFMHFNGEGVAQDYKEAVRLYKLAVAQGNTDAQFGLATMYATGQGVMQDYIEAARLCGLAAAQGLPAAKFMLAAIYESGVGGIKNDVVAYALYNLLSNDKSASIEATKNRANLANSMTNAQIEKAQALTKEIAKPGNLLKAIDTYLTKNPSNKQTKVAQNNNDGFPARPAKRPGVVSCNTSCVNASCMRTYDNGKKVRFQARQVFDPFTQQWKFDSGSC